MIFFKRFKNKKVLVTGHTGFKGSWLTIWLKILGAKVLGISNGVLTCDGVDDFMQMAQNIDFTLIDHFEKVTDKDAALMTRQLAKEEGIFAGNSCGAALAGTLQLKDKLSKKDVVVIIMPDHGSRYIGKIYNDDWMKNQSFI